MTSAVDRPAHDALHVMYSNHHGWLHGWLRRKLGCTHQAADLAQDTFLRVIDRPRELNDVREPRAYLTTIAHSLVVNHWRRHAIEQAYLDALLVMPQAVTQSPEERHLLIEALEEIAAMLDGLPARTREIFLLSQLDGLSYPQIAEQVGVTVNVVQKAMIKASTRCYAMLYA